MTPPALGNINASHRMTLIKRGKIVGYCNSGTNPVAYAFKATGATMAIGQFSRYKKSRTNENSFERTNRDGFTMLSKNRVKMAGWMDNDKQAGLMLV